MAETALTIDLDTKLSWRPGTGDGARVLQIEEFYTDDNDDGFDDDFESFPSKKAGAKKVDKAGADMFGDGDGDSLGLGSLDDMAADAKSKVMTKP